jgi:NAD/NADP transhydrogenase alpha subunit
VLGFVAVFAATINVVGGFVITDRMLKMFRREPTAAAKGDAALIAAKSTEDAKGVGDTKAAGAAAKDAKASGAV